MMKEIDCRGLACPQPVIETKKAMGEIAEGTLLVIVDNFTARQNVSIFARNAGCKVEVEEKEGLYYLTITKGQSAPERQEMPGKQPGSGPGEAPAYFITTNVLGQGSPDLGAVLMKSLMVTLAEQQPVPAALVFLNSGVYLTTEGSPVLEQIQKLEASGTEILSCGTCLDYYRLKEKLQAGRISNMYEINSLLTSAKKVITVG